MPAYASLLSRRSIRKFKYDHVPDVLIEVILRAAMAAPSTLDGQPWEFLVVRDREKHKKIMEILPRAFAFKTASVGILVLGSLRREKIPGSWVIDASCALENMLLAAPAKGLGSVSCGIWPEQDKVAAVRELFSLPSELVPLAVCAVGFPDEEPLFRKDRYDPARVHQEAWKEPEPS